MRLRIPEMTQPFCCISSFCSQSDQAHIKRTSNAHEAHMKPTQTVRLMWISTAFVPDMVCGSAEAAYTDPA